MIKNTTYLHLLLVLLSLAACLHASTQGIGTKNQLPVATIESAIQKDKAAGKITQQGFKLVYTPSKGEDTAGIRKKYQPLISKSGKPYGLSFAPTGNTAGSTAITSPVNITPARAGSTPIAALPRSVNTAANKHLVADHKITGIIPDRGPRGTEVTISGEKFGNNTADLQVKVNDVAAIITGMSENQIRIIVPDKAGSGPVSVKVKDQVAAAGYYKYEWTCTVSTFAGSPNSIGGSNTSGMNAGIYRPQHMYIDASDNIYVLGRVINKFGDVTNANTSSAAYQAYTEEWNKRKFVFDKQGNKYTLKTHHITKTTQSGVETIFAGALREGKQDGEGTNAAFAELSGICIDSKGNLFVTERDGIELMNHGDRVRMITPAGYVSLIAGGGVKTIGQKGYKDGIGAEALFSYPFDIVVDSQGVLFVSDHFNNCIRKITLQ